MGVRLDFPALDEPPVKGGYTTTFSTTNDVTTRNIGDFSGGVGQTVVTGVAADSDLIALSAEGEEVIVSVDNVEVSRGRVRDVSLGETLSTLTADTTIVKFNAYLAVDPFVGTLSGAMNYYASLVGGGITYSIPSGVANRSVAFPGVAGNLWDHIKQMLAAEQLELVVLDGVAHVRELRTSVYVGEDFVSRTMNVNNQNSARSIKVHYYGNEEIIHKKIYPYGIESPTVYTVDAGETIVITETLNASLSAVDQPVAVDTIDLGTTETFGQYAISDNTGAPVPASAWVGLGGAVRTKLIDHQTLEITIRGMNTGAWEGPFRIAESSGDALYPALYVTGTGVRRTDESVTLHTGATSATTGQDVGVEITNPFVRTKAQAYSCGMVAAGKSEITVSHSGSTSVKDAPTPGDRIMYRSGYYRVTSVTVSDSDSSYTAEQDTTMADMSAQYAGFTMGDFTPVNMRLASLTPLNL